MKTHKREILIYYNPDSGNDRKTVALAKSLAAHVRAYTFAQAPSTGMSWGQILHALALDPKELLNKADPYYQSNIRGRDFDQEGWLNVIQKNPSLLKAPIAMRGDKAVLCINATDVCRLG